MVCHWVNKSYYLSHKRLASRSKSREQTSILDLSGRHFLGSPPPLANANHTPSAGASSGPEPRETGPCTHTKVPSHRMTLRCRITTEKQACFVMKGFLSPNTSFPYQPGDWSLVDCHLTLIPRCLGHSGPFWEFSRDRGPGRPQGGEPCPTSFSSHLEDGVDKGDKGQQTRLLSATWLSLHPLDTESTLFFHPQVK